MKHDHEHNLKLPEEPVQITHSLSPEVKEGVERVASQARAHIHGYKLVYAAGFVGFLVGRHFRKPIVINNNLSPTIAPVMVLEEVKYP